MRIFASFLLCSLFSISAFAQDFQYLPNYRIPALTTFSGSQFFGGINPNWYRSVDGRHWEKLASFAAPGVIRILEAEHDTLFVRTTSGSSLSTIYSSFDAGKTWQQRFISDSSYWNSQIARILFNKGVIFTEMVSADGRFLMSPDLGATWKPIDGVSFGYGKMVEDNGVVLLVNAYGIYEHSFNENRWLLKKDLSSLELNFVNAVFENNEVFVFLTDLTVSSITSFKLSTSDYNLTQTSFTQNLTEISRCGSNYYATGTGQINFRSSDGLNWIEVTEEHLKYSEIGNGILIRNGSQSPDCGLTWNAGTYGVPRSAPAPVTASVGVTDSAIYVAQWSGILKAKSFDDEWTRFDSPINSSAEPRFVNDKRALAIITNQNDVYELPSSVDSVIWRSKLPNFGFFYTLMGEALYYIDGAFNWTTVKYSPDFGATIFDIPLVTKPNAICKSREKVFVLNDFQDIYEISSTNPDAANFRTQTPGYVNRIFSSTEGVLFAVGNDKVFRFSNGTWTDITDEILPFTGSQVNIETLAGSDTLIASFYTLDAMQVPEYFNFYSVDHGLTWILLPDNAIQQNATSLLADVALNEVVLFSSSIDFLSRYRLSGSSESIEPKANANTLEVRPNPTNGKFALTRSTLMQGQLRVFNQLGTLMCSDVVTNSTGELQEFDCNLPSGIYTVVYQGRSVIECTKLIIIK
jgi:hypothetical protein